MVSDESRDAQRRDAIERVNRLSPREREILDLVVTGKPSKVIARELHLSRRTVEKHRANLTQKLGLRSVADVIRTALNARE